MDSYVIWRNRSPHVWGRDMSWGDDNKELEFPTEEKVLEFLRCYTMKDAFVVRKEVETRYRQTGV